MTEDYFETHLAKAANEDPASDPHLRQFWQDEVLTHGIVAAVPHEGGVATMHHLFHDQRRFEVLPLTWAELHEEYNRWSELEIAA